MQVILYIYGEGGADSGEAFQSLLVVLAGLSDVSGGLGRVA